MGTIVDPTALLPGLDPTAGYVALDMSLNLPLPQCLHLQNGSNKTTYLTGLL